MSKGLLLQCMEAGCDGIPLYPCTGKVEERQEDHELKVSLHNISLGQPTYTEILS